MNEWTAMGRSYSDIKGSFGWMEERKRTDRETERQRDRREVKRRERGQTGRRTKKKGKREGGVVYNIFIDASCL